MVGANHPKTDAYAFAVSTLSEEDNSFPTDSLKAIAGRDLDYVKQMSD